MERLYYSTGQVARQLGVTLPTVRTLCENHVIVAQTTPGGQWRVPAAEVERLKRDGLPPIPRRLPREPGLEITDEPFDHTPYSKFLPQSSEQVAAAADQVAITKCTLERRRFEREIEETEDWFRDRERQEAVAKAADREKEQAKQAEQQRFEWIQQWINYALKSLPYEARQEVEIEVHSMVQTTLSGVPASQPETITRRLVEAAVHRALAPWTRKQEINRALQTSAGRLPWDVRNRSEYAALKQRAWDAAALALGRVRDDASYNEMETAATQAVQPMIREYRHDQACQRIVGSVYIPGATCTEVDAAKEAVRQVLVALPASASAKQLDLAEETALAPYKAAVAVRREKARLADEKEAQRRSAEFKVCLEIGHIFHYLEKEYEFDDGYLGQLREADRLRPLIRKTLVEELIDNPDMSSKEIKERIEDQVDEQLD